MSLAPGALRAIASAAVVCAAAASFAARPAGGAPAIRVARAQPPAQALPGSRPAQPRPDDETLPGSARNGTLRLHIVSTQGPYLAMGFDIFNVDSRAVVAFGKGAPAG